MRTLLLTFLSALLLTACGGDTASADGTDLPSTIAEAEEALGYNNSGPSCLSEEGTSLCDFLTEDMVAKYLPEGFEQSAYKAEERGMLSGCGYSFDHPTKTVELKVGTMTMNLPATYTITLNGVRTAEPGKGRDRFAGEYRVMSEQEIAATRESMRAGLRAKLDAGEITQEQFEMSSSFGNAIGKSKWEPVEGLGDAAVWGNALPEKEPESMGTLAVLTGDTQFSLAVDLVGTKAESRAAAVELARGILGKCE